VYPIFLHIHSSWQLLQMTYDDEAVTYAEYC